MASTEAISSSEANSPRLASTKPSCTPATHFSCQASERPRESASSIICPRVKDDRALVVGVFLRKTALDELPQMLNILRGDMSFVGPRPLRTVQVYGWLQEIPQWAVRHQVRPGLSGLAQVVGSYYYSPLQKLRYDRIYIRHISLAFDLKLLFLAFMVVFYLRWHADWDGHIPRRWLRWGTRPSVRLEARPAEVAAE